GELSPARAERMIAASEGGRSSTQEFSKKDPPDGADGAMADSTELQYHFTGFMRRPAPIS
ncbi:MAG: hypothetical protein ACRD4Y_05600, partial [Candidatus Acidiferrales bacterium]